MLSSFLCYILILFLTKAIKSIPSGLVIVKDVYFCKCCKCYFIMLHYHGKYMWLQLTALKVLILLSLLQSTDICVTSFFHFV